MPFTVLLGNQNVKEPDVSTFEASDIHNVKHIDDLLELLKVQNRYRHVYVSNVGPADAKKATTSRLHMHYKMSCPYTRKALYMIERFQKPIVVAMHNADRPDLRSKVESYLQHTRKFDGTGRLTFPQFFFNGNPLGGTDTLADHVDKIVGKVSADQIDQETAKLYEIISEGNAVGPRRTKYFDSFDFTADMVSGAAYKSNVAAAGLFAKITSVQEFVRHYIYQRYPEFRKTRSAPDAVHDLLDANADGDLINNNVSTWQRDVNTVMTNALPAELLQFKFVLFKDTVEYDGLNDVDLGGPDAVLKTALNGAILHKARLEAAKAYLDALIAGGAAAAAADASAARAAAVSVMTDYFTALKESDAVFGRVKAATGAGAIDRATHYTAVRAAVQAAVGGAAVANKVPTAAGYVVKVYVNGAANPPAYVAPGIDAVRTKALIQGVYNFVADPVNTKNKSVREIAEAVYDELVTTGLAGAQLYYTLAQGVYTAMLLYDATGPYVSFGRSRRGRRRSVSYKFGGARKKSTRKKTSTRRKKKSTSFGKKRKTSIKKSRKTRGRNA